MGFFRRMDGISIKMLLSYFSILLVPLCVIAIIYGAAMDAILVSRQESSLNGLKESASITSARVEELSNISAYIYSNPYTNAIINRSRHEPNRRDIYSFYQAIDSLPSYKLTNQMIEDIFIFFNEAEFVIKQPNAFAFNAYSYDQHIRFHGIAYEEIRALSRLPYTGGLMVTSDADGRDVLLLRSIPNTSVPEGLIVIRLNAATLDSIMSTNDVGPGGGAYILTRDGQFLSDVGDAPFTAQALTPLLDGQRLSYREIEHAGKRYLLCQVMETGLTYVTVTQKDYLLANIAPIRYLITLMSVAAAVVGSMICIALWRRRSKVVKNIASTARSVGVEYDATRSESHLLEYTVSTLASTVDILRETMDRQRETLSQTVLQGCLSGAFATRADMLREVEGLSLPLLAPHYHVVRVSLLDPWEVRADNAQILPYRVFLKQFLAERLHIPHVIADIDGASFLLLLTEQEPHSEQALVALFCALSGQVGERDWEVPSFAVSGGCDDLWDVRRIYAQTEEINGYMALLERRGVCGTEDLPQPGDAMYFPMDMEIRLIQVMQSGSPQELEALFAQIMQENLARRTLGVAMLSELFEALRRSILRAIQEGNGPAVDLNAAVAQLARVKSLKDLQEYAARAQEQMSRVSEAQNTQENQRMKQTLQSRIEENLSNPTFSLYMLSEMVGIPEGTLYRTFKDTFGISFSGYLEQCRINRAFELLKGQTLIKDVAEQVGYTSDHTFRRAFKRVMKVPPSQFAKLTHPQQ